jgi:Rrf2 family transcriptional regulator, iron-sulfur cluster assembly transcription factor
MKLSARCRYGLRAAFDIAFHNRGRPTRVREMSKRQGVGPRMLEQVLARLKAAGLVGAQRGRRGGYFLARPAAEISVGDVVRACDGALRLTVGQASKEAAAPADAVWAELDREVTAAFDSISLAEICRRTERAGVRRAGPDRQTMFFI